jgi:hypothetical protein
MIHAMAIAALAVIEKELWNLEPKIRDYIVKEVVRLSQMCRGDKHGKTDERTEKGDS